MSQVLGNRTQLVNSINNSARAIIDRRSKGNFFLEY